MQQVPWSAIQAAETGETVSNAVIEADGGQSVGTVDAITNFTFDRLSLSFFTD